MSTVLYMARLAPIVHPIVEPDRDICRSDKASQSIPGLLACREYCCHFPFVWIRPHLHHLLYRVSGELPPDGLTVVRCSAAEAAEIKK